MKNLRNLNGKDSEGGKLAFLFVFLTVLIGSSAVLPTAVFQDNKSQRLDGAVFDDFAESSSRQTGRYLKMPSRF